jgi:hypothetical protein
MENASNTTKKMILAWPMELKLQTLRELNEAGDIGMLMAITNVLLEAPLSEGGVSSDVIQEIIG